MAEEMNKWERRKLLALGLEQLDDDGLRRIESWNGEMLLSGSIASDGLY